MNELQERYDILFKLYVAHIHEHRLGVGETCKDCERIVNEQIDAALRDKQNENSV